MFYDSRCRFPFCVAELQANLLTSHTAEKIAPPNMDVSHNFFFASYLVEQLAIRLQPYGTLPTRPLKDRRYTQNNGQHIELRGTMRARNSRQGVCCVHEIDCHVCCPARSEFRHHAQLAQHRVKKSVSLSRCSSQSFSRCFWEEH